MTYFVGTHECCPSYGGVSFLVFQVAMVLRYFVQLVWVGDSRGLELNVAHMNFIVLGLNLHPNMQTKKNPH